MTHAERLLALAEKGNPNSRASHALRKAVEKIGQKPPPQAVAAAFRKRGK